MFLSKYCFSQVGDTYIWQPDDDMLTNLFYPFEDDLSQYTHDYFQSSFKSCDAYPFGDSVFFYEEFKPPSCSDSNGHQVMAHPEYSKAHTTKSIFFHIGVLGRDL